jgi:prepilin signal peptidase PulO-like enzyme (type II secretory pathway)
MKIFRQMAVRPGQAIEVAAFIVAGAAAFHVFSTTPAQPLVFIIGLCIPFVAEFSTTMAFRYQSWMTPRETFARLTPMSRCDVCQEPLGWRAFPYLQMAIGRGRCKCSSFSIDRTYSYQSAAFLALFIVLSIVTWVLHGPDTAARLAVVFLVGLPLVIMDIFHQEVDEAILTFAVILALVIGWKFMAWQPAMVLTVGFVLAGVVASTVRGEPALGFMDVVVAAVFGAFLTIPQVLTAFALSGLALVLIVAAYAGRQAYRREELDLDRPWPFIPAMWAGTLASLILPSLV